jgi:Mg2+ and Co2+ transporter CorA
VHSDGHIVADPSAADLTAAAAGREPFWLDLPGVSQQQAGWLEDIFGLHPLVVEDAQQFGERLRSSARRTAASCWPSSCSTCCSGAGAG